MTLQTNEIIDAITITNYLRPFMQTNGVHGFKHSDTNIEITALRLGHFSAFQFVEEDETNQFRELWTLRVFEGQQELLTVRSAPNVLCYDVEYHDWYLDHVFDMEDRARWVSEILASHPMPTN